MLFYTEGQMDASTAFTIPRVTSKGNISFMSVFQMRDERMGQATWTILLLWQQFGVDNENVYCLKENQFILGKKLMMR